MGTTRRGLVLGASALGVAGLGSGAHQAWLSSTARIEGLGDRPAAIPVFDLRGSDTVSHSLTRRERAQALADACIGPLTPAARAGLAGADALARRWLRSSGSPYVDELDRIAAASGARGVHLLNASYEWGCTSLAAPSPSGTSARLLRTLDWPFRGLGRLVEAWHMKGDAGEYLHLSWPGFVGMLTGMAPGRFAAAINQPPLKRRAPGDLVSLDAALAGLATWRSSGRMPALHLLRRTFETAPDYGAARALLERTPVAAPAIFTLVGVAPRETSVIERDVDGFHTREGVASAANVWRYGSFPGEWHGGRSSEMALDSAERSAMIETWAGRGGEPFEWVKSPILNEMTRLAVEADPAEGTLRALGFEEGVDLPERVTLPLEWKATVKGDGA